MEKKSSSKWNKKVVLKKKKKKPVLFCKLWMSLISCQAFIYVVLSFTSEWVALKMNSWNDLTESLELEITNVNYKRGS